MLTRRRKLVTTCFLALFTAVPGLSDGKIFRHQYDSVGEPLIRSQRAVVAWKDGIETMIVQSDVAVGEKTAKDYGWILPLPAEPTSIEACAPGTLKLLSAAFGPRFSEGPGGFLWLAILILLFMALECRSMLLNRGPRPTAMRVAFLLLAMSAFSFCFLPSLNTAGVEITRSDVAVTQTVRAGVYDVRIIKGDTGKAVTDWLTENGFAAPATAASAIDQYVKDGWRFLAAKVAPDGDGALTHHPLKVTFPAKQAVYPLRITGSDGEGIELDLFVIANQAASAPGMRMWARDRFIPNPDGAKYDALRGYVAEFGYDAPVPWIAPNSGDSLGAAEMTSAMWPGCCVTRLHGWLPPSAMRADLTLAWSAPNPNRHLVFSKSDAMAWAATVVILILTLALPTITSEATRRGWTILQAVRHRSAPAIAIAVLGGATMYAILDVVPISRGLPTWAVRRHMEALAIMQSRQPVDPVPEAYGRIIGAFIPTMPQAEQGNLDHPGDFAFVADGDGWRLTIIDASFTPISVLLSAEGKLKRAPG
ncbi:MAG: DUF2330 domain-containing protein [Phycisphaerales bacterium]|nr:DUF2330 domain-containing protein [Phycisphaerales bacterium]